MEVKRENLSTHSIDFDARLRIKLWINIGTLISVSFAILVCLLIIIYVIIMYNSRKQSKNSFNISLLLTCNTCFAIICSSTILVLIQLSNIAGDREVLSLQWLILWGCHFRGYLLLVFIDAIYLSFVLQAGFRLFRIVFHEYPCVQTVSSFSCYILCQWMISFLILLPILFAGKNHSNSIVYLPEDFYCQVPVTNAYSIAYSILVVYLLPVCCMCIIYLWIILHIRQKSRRRRSSPTLNVRGQYRRDQIIIKRICVVMFSLVTVGAPSVIFFIGFLLTHQLHWTFYRFSWFTISISYVFICLSSVYVTPQIYTPIRVKIGYLKRPSHDDSHAIPPRKFSNTKHMSLQDSSSLEIIDSCEANSYV